MCAANFEEEAERFCNSARRKRDKDYQTEEAIQLKYLNAELKQYLLSGLNCLRGCSCGNTATVSICN